MKNLDKYREIKIHSILSIRFTGRRISVRCPFHRDRTPSLCLYPDGSYYCFGCTAKGSNAIDFLMGLGATFKEALEELKNYL